MIFVVHLNVTQVLKIIFKSGIFVCIEVKKGKISILSAIFTFNTNCFANGGSWDNHEIRNS